MIKISYRSKQKVFNHYLTKLLMICICAAIVFLAVPQMVNAAPKTTLVKDPKPTSIIISSLTDTIISGQSTLFTVEAYDNLGASLGDITTSVRFTIDKEAAGYWVDNEYYAEAQGTWLVEAEYRGTSDITQLTVISEIQEGIVPTEIINPPVSPEEPFVSTQKIDGEFFSQYNSVAEYEDMIAFVYYSNGASMVHIESDTSNFDYTLPEVENFGLYNVKAVLSSKTELWVAYGLPIKINCYQITDNGLTLVNKSSIGDSYSRLKGFIKLKSGKLLLSWYQHQRATDNLGNNGVNVGFAYYDGSWNHLPYTFVYPNTYPTNAALCQHPADSSIWWFSVHDGNHTIKVIHLIDTGSEVIIDWVDYDFITIDDPLAPEGEFPWITAVADKTNNSILIAYQNNDRYWFSYDPFCKGAKINIVSVKSSGDKQLIDEVPYYTERIIPVSLGVTGGLPWVAYGSIDENELDWNDLYLYSNGQNTLLGELQYGTLDNQFIRICNSSEMIIALMSDGLIHFFPAS